MSAPLPRVSLPMLVTPPAIPDVLADVFSAGLQSGRLHRYFVDNGYMMPGASSAPVLGSRFGHARSGDTVHVRSHNPYAWTIRKCIPSWGSHDGLLVWFAGKWYVYEALLKDGYVKTPLDKYVSQVVSGDTSLVFLRVRSGVGYSSRIPEEIYGLLSAVAAEKLIGSKYDKTAIFTIFYNILMKTTFCRQSEFHFYCTEANAHVHTHLEWEGHPIPVTDIWGKDLPTPYTTEKRHIQGYFHVLSEMIAEGDSEYSPHILELMSANSIPLSVYR